MKIIIRVNEVFHVMVVPRLAHGGYGDNSLRSRPPGSPTLAEASSNWSNPICVTAGCKYAFHINSVMLLNT